MSAWVLIPSWQTTTQKFLLSLQTLKILTSPSRQTKSSDNSNTLNMFNNDTYTNFKTAYKHMLILWWCHAQELFGSQIPVTTGGIELWISCIQSNYVTHKAIRPNRLGGFRVPECKRFVEQTLLWSLKGVIQIILEHDTIAIWNFTRSLSISTS